MVPSKVSHLYLRNSRFVRGTQEDSHEALRCLFDAVKNEEVEVCIFYFHAFGSRQAYSMYIYKYMDVL